MFQTILVPLDGSDRAEWALPAAVSLGRAARARIGLLTVEVSIPLVGVGVGLMQPERNTFLPDSADYLRRTAYKLTEQGIDVFAVTLPEPAVMLPGSIGEEIAHRAEQIGAGLIVMTTHARRSIARMVLGSVARDTVHASTVPVLLIKPPDVDQPPSFQLPRLRHILIALDASPFSEEILDYAIELGRCCNAQYTIVTVVQPVHVAGIPVDQATLPIDSYGVAERQQLAEKYQDEVIARMRFRGLSVAGTVVTADSAARGIAAVAHDVGADVIALTTHARSGARTLVLGSVAQQVIRELSTPVLVYRPQS